MQLAGKTALVTGATSGIGLATARAFAAAGARMVLTGRDRTRGAALVAELGPIAKFIAADLAEPGAAERIASEALTDLGHIDILVNNAGILFRGDALACTDDQWDRTLAVNVTAVFRMSRAVLVGMRGRRSGAIVNVASDWALVGAQGAVAYGVSKGAVAQLTRSMALDHARDGIRVNAVCPGDTDTSMLDSAISAGSDRSVGLAELGAAIPMRRVGRPDEVAKVILFLASDAASFMTGALVPVDGGNSAQ